jgi:hypothetical protein
MENGMSCILRLELVLEGQQSFNRLLINYHQEASSCAIQVWKLPMTLPLVLSRLFRRMQDVIHGDRK